MPILATMKDNEIKIFLVFALILLGVVGFFARKILEKDESNIQTPQTVAQEEGSNEITEPEYDGVFSFYLASDMRCYSGQGVYDSSSYFRGAVEKIYQLGSEDFLIIPGDLDPVEDVEWTISQVLGKDYTWYPVIGNHELPGQGTEDYEGKNLELLNSYNYQNVKAGPSPCAKTMYSFDYENSHFVALNVYCDTDSETATDGDITDFVYNWLVSDLAVNEKENVFVVGHECAYPQPDRESGRERHVGDSLDLHPENRDRFWDLLASEGVVAYFCAHTHNYSTYHYQDVWQIDSGHARGIGDTESKSTFVKINVNGTRIGYQTYRYDVRNQEYILEDEGNI